MVVIVGKSTYCRDDGAGEEQRLAEAPVGLPGDVPGCGDSTITGSDHFGNQALQIFVCNRHNASNQLGKLDNKSKVIIISWKLFGTRSITQDE